MTDFWNKVKRFYEQKYKILQLIPLILVLLSLIQIGWQYHSTGDFVNKGISLKGGSTITFAYKPSMDRLELQNFLSNRFPGAEINIRTLTSAGKITNIAVDSAVQDSDQIEKITAVLREKLSLREGDYNVEIVGSSLGDSFFRQTIKAMIFAFVLMGIAVFLYFRIPLPSLAVIASAFSDIIVTLAIFNLTGMKLSTAGIAAFLMLIGYSVDTDMLLTTRVFKRKEGEVMERIYSSIRTGMTMIFTSIAAVGVALIFVQSEAIKQIMLIIFIGLIVDMLMTWIQNVGFVRMYLERVERKKNKKA